MQAMHGRLSDPRSYEAKARATKLQKEKSSDTANKDFSPQQGKLFNAVTALGKPTIAVISMEGPYAVASVIVKLLTVLTDYYGGPHQAIALPTPSSASRLRVETAFNYALKSEDWSARFGAAASSTNDASSAGAKR